MAAIGAAYGYNWQTLWNHPQNANLKNTRKDPNVLFPGDFVFIPEKTLRLENCVTDKCHKFVLKGVPEILRICLLNEFDHPLSGIDYELQVGAESPGHDRRQRRVEREDLPRRH
jgi:N-acetylmuramoyl-L-alanine amidase